MAPRASLSIYETQRLTSRGIPVSVGVLELTMPDGTVHRFPIISGGFGRGAAPGLHEDLRSANGQSFQGRDVQAVYPIAGARRASGDSDMHAGGADFFIRLASPADAHRGRTWRDIGLPGALGIHPDGDSHDLNRPISGARRLAHDGRNNDGTNGCFGIAAEYARQFQDLYFSLPPGQRPDRLLVTAPPAPVKAPPFSFFDIDEIAPPLPTPSTEFSAARNFPNLAK